MQACGKPNLVATEKKLAKTNLQALNNEESARYEIFQAIETGLPRCNSLSELEALLLRQRIDMQYKYKGDTDEIQGISFRKGQYSFKGSSIDRKFSFAGLQKAMQQKEIKQQQILPTPRRGMRR